MDRRSIMKMFAATPALLKTGVPEALTKQGINVSAATKGAAAMALSEGPSAVPATLLHEGSRVSYLTQRLFAMQEIQRLGYDMLFEDHYPDRFANVDHYEGMKSVSPVMKQHFRRAKMQREALPRQIEVIKQDIKKASLRELLPAKINQLIGNF